MTALHGRAALGVLPIVLLIYLMTKRSSVPSHKALPISAFLVYLIVLGPLRIEWMEVHATVILGVLTAFTPISIIWGAIFLFRTMESTGALDTLREWLDSISPNPVAQLMIVGWAFPFLIEGASGFGTPAALAAPILVGLGFEPFKVAVLSLVMNSIPVSFGAVGTPVWFGFEPLALSQAELLSVGVKSTIVHSFAAIFIPIVALNILLDIKTIRQNLLFIILSIVVTLLPFFFVACISYEFPALVGGGIGLIGTVLLAKRSFGLVQSNASDERAKVNGLTLSRALFPLVAVVLVLVLTRLPQLPLKNLLTAEQPRLSIQLGSFGVLSISRGLVIQLQDTLGTGLSWIHQLLYIPSIVPFIVVSLVSTLFYTRPLEHIRNVTCESLIQMKNPTLALLAALIFVKLLMMGGQDSIVTAIGESMAQLTGSSWTFFAAYLGALGSFFSGSATISNLTFGGIQHSIAKANSFDVSTILALQSVGSAMGNMVCINNIVAVCSVLGLQNIEGQILKKTVGVMVAYGVVAGCVGYCLLP